MTIDGNSSQTAASCLDQDYEQVFPKAHHMTPLTFLQNILYFSPASLLLGSR